MVEKTGNPIEPAQERVENLGLPYHLIRAKDWDGLEKVLCALTFLEEKIAAGLVHELNI